MINMRFGDIAKATGGKVVSGSAEGAASGVSIDSRTVEAGMVFLALRGPNFDGRAFVRDAALKGAAGAVTEGMPDALGLPDGFVIIVVKDTRKALGDLAAYRRRFFSGPVVAVSGSSGKTTAKEMIAAILGRTRRVLKTEGNKNNLIGLPLTLMRLDNSYEAAVVELGISEQGEMPRLAQICSPDAAVITNIGRGHLKTFGSLEAVARAKTALFDSLGTEGFRIVNLDDPWLQRSALVKDRSSRAITFGHAKEADVRVRRCSTTEDMISIEAVFDVRGEIIDVRIAAPGVFNAMNGAAAIAAVLPFGVCKDDIAGGLASFVPVSGRMEVLRAGGVVILNDTYNANPESMAAALMTLSSFTGRKVAVLGDMLELGGISNAAHEEAGRLAAKTGVDILVAVGQWSKALSEGALEAGLKPDAVFSFADKLEAQGAVSGLLRQGDTVLVKGSRAVGLEFIVDGIKAGAGNRLSQ
ncbi:MAG: UDP-N-acetylmuramoyl-tripeptide--D-alanyl-D-alanine ligase [Deltaproteobacteria bacterium]|nr:UDP-N-acetylmuramoyl-tripeptide--D-alanyl-D-alanine ligase [Deltaproteobacteria bacterium]